MNTAYSLFVHTRSGLPESIAAASAVPCASASAESVAHRADIVFTMRPGTLDVETVLFASKAGADPARVREALMGGFASSRIVEAHGERTIKRRSAPRLASACIRRT